MFQINELMAPSRDSGGVRNIILLVWSLAVLLMLLVSFAVGTNYKSDESSRLSLGASVLLCGGPLMWKCNGVETNSSFGLESSLQH